MDPDLDSDPAFFVIDLQDANKKLMFLNKFFCLLPYCLKVHLHDFLKIKSQKESQNSRNQGFSYYFCMMIEGSGSGFIPLTSGSGSGSGRPKNMWIRWIRIRIRNTGCWVTFVPLEELLADFGGELEILLLLLEEPGDRLHIVVRLRHLGQPVPAAYINQSISQSTSSHLESST
jgi:hypothetical protein